MAVNKQFMKWAQSFSGCDGGNPKGTWFCGIEFGMGDIGKNLSVEEYQNEVLRYYRDILNNQIQAGDYVPDTSFELGKNTKYPFGLKLAKLYRAIRGDETKNIDDFAKNCLNNEIFKINLYPIPFADTSHEYWKKYELADLTGLQNKQAYLTWCAINRFPSFVKKVRENDPKLIMAPNETQPVLPEHEKDRR